MTIIGLASVGNSPGVTTFATLLASSINQILVDRGSEMKSLLVEADPSGSKVALHYDLANNSVHDYVSSNSISWEPFAEEIPGGTQILTLKSYGDFVKSDNMLSSVSDQLFNSLAMNDSTFSVVDFGRLYPGSNLLKAAGYIDALYILIKRDKASIVFASQAVKNIIGFRTNISWAVVGKKGHNNSTIQEYTGGVPVGVDIPDDEVGAGALFDKPRQKLIKRSNLGHAVVKFSKKLVDEHDGGSDE